MRLAVIGPPGSGKTTQAKLLAQKLSLSHIYMGELARKAVAKKLELGEHVKAVLKEGELVEDELILRLFFERVSQKDCHRGFVSDGTPRTLIQAKKIEERFPLDKVVSVKISLPTAKERLLKRGRADDTEETITHRFQVYEEKNRPILAFYQKKGRLLEVDGEKNPKEVAAEIFKKLGIR